MSSNAPSSSTSLCPPLNATNLGQFGSPQGFFDWNQKNWTAPVNPNSFNAGVFTTNCVLTDPSGTVTGNVASAAYFAELFQYFPALSGQFNSVSSTANTITIDWAFVTGGGAATAQVPCVDVFCLTTGLVSQRVAKFDALAFLLALGRAYGWETTFKYIDARWATWYDSLKNELLVSVEAARVKSLGAAL